MKHQPLTLLMFGHDEALMETRKWVLQSRGYRVVTVENLAGISAMSATTPVALILLCHTLSAAESETAVLLAHSRWPDAPHLALTEMSARAHGGILGQLLHSEDGPAKLISQVEDLVRPKIVDNHAEAS